MKSAFSKFSLKVKKFWRTLVCTLVNLTFKSVVVSIDHEEYSSNSFLVANDRRHLTIYLSVDDFEASEMEDL